MKPPQAQFLADSPAFRVASSPGTPCQHWSGQDFGGAGFGSSLGRSRGIRRKPRLSNSATAGIDCFAGGKTGIEGLRLWAILTGLMQLWRRHAPGVHNSTVFGTTSAPPETLVNWPFPAGRFRGVICEHTLPYAAREAALVQTYRSGGWGTRAPAYRRVRLKPG
jgi:hypothetical protein